MATAPSTLPFETVSQFDLQKEVDQAEARRPWPSGIYAKTLLKHNDMRVVLILMDADATMKEHHADGSVALQVLLGKLRVTSQNIGYRLPARGLLTLPPSMPHQVHALDPSAFLLTISWPDSETLQALPHRGYGS